MSTSMLLGGGHPQVGQGNAADAQVEKIISGLTSYTRNSEFMYNLRRVIGLKNGGEITALPDLQPPATHPRAKARQATITSTFRTPTENLQSNP